MIAAINRRYASMLVGLCLLSTISLFIGVGKVDLFTLFVDKEALQTVAISRLPRTFSVLLTGASMAVSGVVMQLLVRNKFVEPSTTGTTEAALLGVLVVTLLSPTMSIMGKMVFASVSALIGMAIFMALIKKLSPKDPLLVPLVGLIYSGIIGAGATFLAYQADLIQYLGTWMTGDFSGVLAGRYELLWLAGFLAALAYLVADQFTILGLGRSASLSLGLNYNQIMAVGLVAVSMITALVVVTVGIMPFVGLVIPNIVARFMGDNLRSSLPVIAGTGAGFVLLSDIIGRVVRFPYEIPAGTVFGVIGASVFIWILYARPAYAK